MILLLRFDAYVPRREAGRIVLEERNLRDGAGSAPTGFGRGERYQGGGYVG
jgi:hypothetical protein